MKLASIETITDIFPHTNSDHLEFCRVLGFTCIVRKGYFKAGDLCILIQPDTLLPTTEWSAPYIKNGNRVRAAKIRGMWSFGIVESLELLVQTNVAIEAIVEGTEVSKELCITKYESPEPEEPGAESGFPYWMRKTGEDMWQTLPLEEYYGQAVDVTLKVDGKSMSVFSLEELGDSGDFEIKKRYCGRRLIFKPDTVNEYSEAGLKADLFGKLEQLKKDCGLQLVLRGELFKGDFYLYGVYNPAIRYNYGPNTDFYFEKIGLKYGIKTVLILEKQVVLTKELIEKYQNLPDLNGEAFEGVVVVGDGFSFKVINLNYDSKK